jgi:hypothetical protein
VAHLYIIQLIDVWEYLFAVLHTKSLDDVTCTMGSRRGIRWSRQARA